MTIPLKLTVLLGLLFLISPPLMAQRKTSDVNPLMACLGKEELRLHRTRSGGPAYFLNQHFIKELSPLYGLNLKKEILDRVCQKGTFSPSVNLLQALLLKGRQAYDLHEKDADGSQALAKSSLNSFLESLPQVFYSYLSHLQALTPHAGCLEREIPEIAFFMEKSKYLEDIIGADIIFKNPKKIKAIFKKLEKFDAILESCAQRKSKKSKN